MGDSGKAVGSDGGLAAVNANRRGALQLLWRKQRHLAS